ncbi:uncharacterized protein K444DRAFT_548073, partial [Hyaloscypha bicolor E]
FQEYYKIYNIITFKLPLYLFHLIQPLNIRYFSILKQIEIFIKAYINYIIKVKFFLAFIVVYKKLIIAQNT